MDGRGHFIDNIFIERLWRSMKYEEVYLKAYADGREARAGIGAWMVFYNYRRPHQAMNNKMPMEVWRDGMDMIEAAARGTCAIGGWMRGGSNDAQAIATLHQYRLRVIPLDHLRLQRTSLPPLQT